MSPVLSRVASPTMLLYTFVVITQIAHGIYAGYQIEPPGAFALLYPFALLWIIGWWLRTDSRKRGVAWVYDMGFFLYVAWPLIMPYYLVKSRGAKGAACYVWFRGRLRLRSVGWIYDVCAGGFFRRLTLLWQRDVQQFVAGERGIAPFATGFVRRGLRASARAAASTQTFGGTFLFVPLSNRGKLAS